MTKSSSQKQSKKERLAEDVNVRLWVKLEGTAVVTMRREYWEKLQADLKKNDEVDLDGLPVYIDEIVNQLDSAIVSDADEFDKIPVTHPKKRPR
jgi:hypothetical protein